MDFLTHSLLPLPEVRDFQQRLSSTNLPWRDGRFTAGDQAALVKHNKQLDHQQSIGHLAKEGLEH